MTNQTDRTVQLRSTSDVTPREGYKQYLSKLSNVGRYEAKGWTANWSQLYFLGSTSEVGVLMEIPYSKYAQIDKHKQIKNDLISAKRGIDDGVDLRRYAERFHSKALNQWILRSGLMGILKWWLKLRLKSIKTRILAKVGYND